MTSAENDPDKALPLQTAVEHEREVALRPHHAQAACDFGLSSIRSVDRSTVAASAYAKGACAKRAHPKNNPHSCELLGPKRDARLGAADTAGEWPAILRNAFL